VSRLIFYSSYAAGMPNPTPEELELSETFEQMIKVGFGRPGSEFRRVFTSMMIPGATEEQMRWLDELQRVATSATTAYRARRQRAEANCLPLLGDLDLPTLILHGLHDQMNGFECGRELAAGIDGARLVPLDTRNHIVLGDEPAWPVFVEEVRRFVAPDGATVPGDALGDISPREREVLTLVAAGRSNDEVAAELVLSVRTVERHLQNVYAKLGVHGPSARVAAAAALART
jgi:DNA-binding CsgD family transcriptional regulator